jgi:phosphoglycolate phosphatase
MTKGYTTTFRFRRPRAVVFDLDGTLIDTAPDLGRALNALLAEHGRPAVEPAAVRHMVGDGAARLVERGFAATGGLPDTLETLTRRFVAHYEAGIADASRPFPGVNDALQRLAAAGIALAVCTNKPDRLTFKLLDALDLRRHFAVIAGGDVPARKPDRRHLLDVLARLRAEASAALMVGDSANDVNVARNAGVAVVAVSYGYTTTPAAALGADALIDRLDQLPGLVGV